MKHICLLFTLLHITTITSLSIQNGELSTPIRGINWFGFENGQTSPDGLWIGGSSIATDMNTVIYRLRLLGFNAVRLPFTFNDLDLPPLPKENTCRTATLQEIIQSVPLSRGTKPLIELPDNNKCNAYLSNKSTLERFIYTLKAFANSGFYVILDYHPMGKEAYVYNPDLFSKKWYALMEKIVLIPELKGKIIMDMMNEPDSMNIKWGHATKLYLKTMDAVHHKLDKSMLYMIEGTGQINYNLNWGDGFVTDPNIIKANQIDDASVFFKELMNKSYIGNIILSPHMYGPSVTKYKRAFAGQELEDRMMKSFLYLHTKGYCFKGRCHKFPIIVGEFGSKFILKEDIEHLDSFQKYMNKYFGKNMNWAFWAYNSNSGDTGGIVKDDWYTLEKGKLDWLRKYMHL